MAKANMYKVSGGIARNKNIPTYFVATILKETEKAVYLYGHGTTATTRLGKCCVCGKTLTHPVSVELGIGPECGKHWWNWDLIGGYTQENIERLKTELVNIKIDCWIPRVCILETRPSEEEVDVPSDHPLIKAKPVPTQTEKDPATAPISIRQYRTASLFKNGQYEIKVSFPFSTIDLDKVKSLPGRTYFSKDRTWSVPFTASSVEALASWGFQLDPVLTKYRTLKNKLSAGQILEREDLLWLRDLEGDKATMAEVSADEIPDIPGLKGTLMPFQKAGVAFIERKRGRVIIGDEMGLGKTVQALAWLQLHPELRPAVIVCPAVAKGVWLNHVKNWMSNVGKIQVLSGSKPQAVEADITIINYDILPNEYEKYIDPDTGKKKKRELPRTGWVDYLKDMGPKVVIADECHYFKNNGANRTLGMKKLMKGVPHILPISGTFIINRPIEGYNAINAVDPSLFPNYINYGCRYCAGKDNGFGWDFSGASNTGELYQKLQSIMIRRVKADVLKDLPDKMYSFVPLELSNREEYDRANNELIAWIAENYGDKVASKAKNAEALVRFNYLKQLTSKGKMNQVISWIRDFLESDGKLVVFATYKTTIDRIMNEFKGISVKIDGTTPQEKRPEIEAQFQTDPNIRLFVGNTKAAGVAITLTASSSVAFVELPWAPGEISQASDRCHRIGQKNAVTIYYLLAEETMDETIALILDAKREVLDAVLDGKEVPDEDSPAIGALINHYRKEEGKE